MIQRKHWAPIAEVVDYLTDRLPAGARVLELGPGTQPFRRADVFVDFQDVATVPADKLVKLDMATQRLPFEDKSFDFVVCRHMLEDMYNPFPVCEEMSRVAKAGYIETPSPVAELCRGVEGDKPIYRGYHHHRFIVWNHNDELRFLTKYPFVEHLNMDDKTLVDALNHSALYWNTYFMWEGEIKFKHLQNPIDYDIGEYHKLLDQAVIDSAFSADAFCSRIIQKQDAA